MRPPIRVTGPSVLPVLLSDAKTACRVAGTESDAAIELLIEAVTGRLDGYSGRLGRTLINQVWRQDFRLFDRGPMRLRFPNVSKATADWINPDGSSFAAAIGLDEDVIGPFVVLNGRVSGPAGFVLRVTYTCGYGDTPDTIPAAIRQAILEDVAHRFLSTSEGGQIRSETVEGIGTTAFNSPEQTALATQKRIDELLKDFRRGNVH